ncbi:MAG: DsrE family protein [Clostridium sp.]|uniref:DsrE family protein n=1 Tax=Clostridium sp. TaxID=1506 RepID=UPI003F3A072F
MKLLIHVGDLEKWKKAIGNAKNTKKLEKDCQIEIIANGVAVIAVKKKISENLGLKEDLERLEELGVKIKVCNNSCTMFDLKKEELLEGIEVVSAAVIEILEKQKEGYAYLKA